MAKLIRRDQIVDDEWTLVRFPAREEPVRKQAGKPVLFKLTGEASASSDDIAALDIPAGKVIVPLPVWLARKEELAARLAEGSLGVWIDSHESPEALAESVADLNCFSVIAVNFPRFIDGRGYSIGALLRTRYGFRGELRAVGDVLRDQLFYLKRCGFDAYAVAPQKNIEEALGGLRDFSEPYQGAVDQPLPLFRRRAHSLAN
ncbi:MAG: DUF934 domain-containing protein [Pseudomonadota bacterium]